MFSGMKLSLHAMRNKRSAQILKALDAAGVRNLQLRWSKGNRQYQVFGSLGDQRMRGSDGAISTALGNLARKLGVAVPEKPKRNELARVRTNLPTTARLQLEQLQAVSESLVLERKKRSLFRSTYILTTTPSLTSVFAQRATFLSHGSKPENAIARAYAQLFGENKKK